MSPLMYAINIATQETCHLDDVVAFLIKKGAGVNIKDNEGTTPLMSTIKRFGSTTIVKLLLEHDALVDETDENGKTSLMHAIEMNRNINIIKLLLQYKSDVCTCDNNGMTPLAFATSIFNDGILGVVKLLTTYQSEVNSADINGNTCLMLAIQATKKADSKGRIHMFSTLKHLKEVGADVNLKNKKGQTAWNIAKDCALLADLENVINLQPEHVTSDIIQEDISKIKPGLFDEEAVEKILSFTDVKSFGREYCFSTKSSRLVIRLKDTLETKTTKESLKKMLGGEYDFEFDEYKESKIQLGCWSDGFITDHIYSRKEGTIGLCINVGKEGNFDFYALTCQHVVSERKINDEVHTKSIEGQVRVLGRLVYCIGLTDEGHVGKYDIAMIKLSKEVVKDLKSNNCICEIKCLCKSDMQLLNTINQQVRVTKIGQSTQLTSGTIVGFQHLKTANITVGRQEHNNFKLRNVMQFMGEDVHGRISNSKFFDAGDSGSVAIAWKDGNVNCEKGVVAMLFGSDSETRECYGFCLACALEEISESNGSPFDVNQIQVTCQGVLCRETPMDLQ
ncbi:unnamed protein product [Owenia fusiformis]|uniref:Uncharacterized protein n=1 Tax=Owenia fusiformis TaxID=6347 RepID=A0A8J1TES1_OWEFU|nr:unnamed protein product [Owenia fusiformis]